MYGGTAVSVIVRTKVFEVLRILLYGFLFL